MKLKQIKSAIDRLTPRERAQLNAWLQGWSDDGWDRQMAADSKNGGKLDKFKRQTQAHPR